MNASRARPKVVIIGLGRLGGALARSLKQARWPVSVLPRSGASVRRAASMGLRLADHSSLSDARLAFLAVPDGAVATLAKELAAELSPSCALIHCAGALPIGVLGSSRAKRPIGSFHPLCAISSPDDSLEGHAVAIAASKPSLAAELQRMAKALKLLPLRVADGDRAAYHAAAVLSAGALVSLLATAVDTMTRTGVSEDDATHALIALMRSALLGVERRGLSRGLTGPIPRGDISVVRAHLGTLPAQTGDLYRALGRRSLALVERELPDETVAAFRTLLGV